MSSFGHKNGFDKFIQTYLNESLNSKSDIILSLSQSLCGLNSTGKFLALLHLRFKAGWTFDSIILTHNVSKFIIL